MTPFAMVSLSRTEVARVADVLQVLVNQRGGRRNAAVALHVSRDMVDAILQRPSALRVRPTVLQAVTVGAGEALGTPVTVEQLLLGHVHLESPAAPARPSGPFASSTRRLVRVRASDAR